MLSFDKREGFVRLAPLNLRESQMRAHGGLAEQILWQLASRHGYSTVVALLNRRR
jgi:hypothetical protein